MTRIYDGGKHTALEAEKARLQTEIETLSIRMNDEYASDGWRGTAGETKLNRYAADNIRHSQLTKEAEMVERQIREMEECRPLSRSERMQNPMLDITRRWCLGGTAMLDEGERQIFMRELDDESARMVRAWVGRGAGSEAFDPWAIATNGGQRPVMAASRSRDGGTGEDLSAAAPETWAAGIVETLAYFGSVPANCHSFNTSDGNDLHVTQLDTADQMGSAITGQGATAIPGATPDALGDAGDVIFRSSWRHSNFIDARIETFQDIHFDVAGRIMGEMTRRLGRGWNMAFTKTQGAGQPQGIVNYATIVDGGAASADDGSGGIGYANLLDMEYTVDLAYLEGGEGGDGGFTDAHGGMIGWMMNRNVEKQLRFAVYPVSGLPVWVPDPSNIGIGTQRMPSRILGYPYTINQAMDDGKSVNDLPLLFGACGHYGVRNIGGPMFYRFWDSNTATQMSVRFIGMSRRDGRGRGPGTVAAGVATATPAIGVLQVKA